MRITLAFTAMILIFQGQAAAQGKKVQPPNLAQDNEYLGRPVEYWKKELHDNQNKDQAKAEAAVEAILHLSADKEAQALAEIIKVHSAFPPPAFSSVPPLDPSLRLALTSAIGLILQKNPKTPDFSKGIDRLKASLKDPQSVVRVRALMALQMLGLGAGGAVNEILAACKDMTSVDVRSQALATLKAVAFDPKSGIPSRIFSEMYQAAEHDPCYKVRMAAIDAMLPSLNLGDARAKAEFEKRMEHLALVDAEPLVKLRANWAVIFVKDEVSEKNVKQIAKIMDDVDPNVRVQALSTAVRISIIKKNSAFIKDLIRKIDDPEPIVRLGAIEGLGLCGRLAGDAVPVLIELMDNDNRSISLAAMQALGNMGFTAKQAVPAILKKMASTDQEVVDTAVVALGNMGDGAVTAVPQLIAKLNDVNLIIRGHAMVALAKIKDKRGAKALLEQLNDPNPNVQQAAVQSLGMMGPTAASAVAPLVALLSGKDENLHLSAIQSLGAIKAKEAVNPLVFELMAKNPKHVEATLIALGTIGSDAKEAVPAIAAKLFDPKPETVYYSIMALAAIGPDAASAVPDLQKVFENPKKHPYIRGSAKKAIDIILKKSDKKEKKEKSSNIRG